jgi:hypothetical protein
MGHYAWALKTDHVQLLLEAKNPRNDCQTPKISSGQLPRQQKLKSMTKSDRIRDAHEILGLTAVMRKLVHICYGVIKHQTPFIPNYSA